MPAEEKAPAPPPHGDLSWDEAACRARLAATTPGEWTHRQIGRTDLHNVEDQVECGDLLIVVAPGAGTDRAAIAGFIAHAPADLRAALAEVDRLRARLEECRQIGVGESDAVAESLKLRSERDHWHRAWAGCRGEIDRLRAVLRPFALQAAVWHADWPDDTDLNEDHDHPRVTVGDCRRAAEVLEGGF